MFYFFSASKPITSLQSRANGFKILDVWFFCCLLCFPRIESFEVYRIVEKNYQFRLVYNRGKSIANKLLVVYILKTGKEKNHLGLSVSKKVGKSVIRSRVSRLIKESYRLNEQSVKLGFDIVVIARNAAKDATYKEISKALLHLLKKHNMLEPAIELPKEWIDSNR